MKPYKDQAQAVKQSGRVEALLGGDCFVCGGGVEQEIDLGGNAERLRVWW